MKKPFYLMLAALLVLVGCTNEELIENSMVKGSIKAALQQGNSTSRMSIGEGNALSWTAGDAFVIFSADGQTKETWSLTQGEGESVAIFTGNMIEGETKGAAYPASANPSLDGTNLTMTLPAERTYSADAACDLPMWANFFSLENNNNITFTHFCALLKVGVNDIPEGYNLLTVEADKPLAGNFVADISWLSGAVALVPTAECSNEVSVSFDAIQSATDNDRMFYLPLPVNNYGSIVIKISNGSNEIVLNEWKNRDILRGKVYWTSLTHRVSEATTAAEVNEELQSLTMDSPTLHVTFANEIDVTESIEIPAVEGATANATLSFDVVPATTASIPLTLVGSATSSDTESDKTTLSFPIAESQPIYLTVETPQNTVTVEQGRFATVVATTAAQTFIVKEGAVIENLIVKGGNVVVYGEIMGSIVRHSDNPDAETLVVHMEGAKMPAKIGDGIKVYSSQVNANRSWYENYSNASEFTIRTREELVGFMDMLHDGTTFQGKTVKLGGDIDMYGYTYQTPGVVYQYVPYGFMGTFDGQGYAIKNLNLEYVYRPEVGYRNLGVGLIPAATSATIQNVTLEGGKVYVPYVKEVIDRNGSVHAATLVGFVNGCVIVNCHNKGCSLRTGVVGYSGGLAGYLRKGSDQYTYIIACSNSAAVTSDYVYNSSNYIGGVTGGGWGQNSFVVGCYNTGHVSYSVQKNYMYAGGVAAVFDGTNYMYGCFNDALVTGAAYTGDLVASASYSGYYRYSCFTGETFAGQDWSGEANRLEIHQCSYAEAVDIMNAGIDAFNVDPYATVKCAYKYVKGSVPMLERTGSFGENSNVTNGTWDAE